MKRNGSFNGVVAKESTAENERKGMRDKDKTEKWRSAKDILKGNHSYGIFSVTHESDQNFCFSFLVPALSVALSFSTSL